jgi:hypothetical protein
VPQFRGGASGGRGGGRIGGRRPGRGPTVKKTTQAEAREILDQLEIEGPMPSLAAIAAVKKLLKEPLPWLAELVYDDNIALLPMISSYLGTIAEDRQIEADDAPLGKLSSGTASANSSSSSILMRANSGHPGAEEDPLQKEVTFLTVTFFIQTYFIQCSLYSSDMLRFRDRCAVNCTCVHRVPLR